MIHFVFSIMIVFAFAAAGAFASVDAPDFYASLIRPGWAPPAEVFGPVWTILYLLMAISLWLVWSSPAPKKSALVLFGSQLCLNALWSWLFFSWHLGAFASFEILLLLLLIIATIRMFWRLHPLAALLLVPYALWVGFASVLSWTIWLLNPQLL